MERTHRRYVFLYRNASVVLSLLMVGFGAYVLALGARAGGWFLIGLGLAYLLLCLLGTLYLRRQGPANHDL